MPGCIKFLKNSYTVHVVDTQPGHVLVDGIPRATAFNATRTSEFHRLGTDYEDFLDQYTDDGDRIRKVKIALERLKDTSQMCHPFT